MMAEKIGDIIERKRGDTAPDVLLVTDSENGGAALDITGYQYTLTVNTVKDPQVGLGSELVQVVGSITDAAGGRVEFPWLPGDADQDPGTYWYDVEQVDAGGRVKTIAKNQYVIWQDISKTN